LTLWTNIDRRFISMGAAGWHICFDVLDRLLSGTPIGRIAGGGAMKFGGWVYSTGHMRVKAYKSRGPDRVEAIEVLRSIRHDQCALGTAFAHAFHFRQLKIMRPAWPGDHVNRVEIYQKDATT
jgi:hypothetical protein